MNITDIRIRKIYEDARLKALVSVTIDGDLAVHDIKVIEGPERLFVAMPSRKDENGTFRDIRWRRPFCTATRPIWRRRRRSRPPPRTSRHEGCPRRAFPR